MGRNGAAKRGRHHLNLHLHEPATSVGLNKLQSLPIPVLSDAQQAEVTGLVAAPEHGGASGQEGIKILAGHVTVELSARGPAEIAIWAESCLCAGGLSVADKPCGELPQPWRAFHSPLVRRLTQHQTAIMDAEPTYTVFIRLPFPRNHFVDPPPVRATDCCAGHAGGGMDRC